MKLGVIGNPIAHSLSPAIHQQFARHAGIEIDYQKFLVEPTELKNFVEDFFKGGGKGLNVTLPFKQAVAECVDQISSEARLAGSINTLTVNEQGSIVGTTTDGVGLLLDLDRLGFQYQNKNILVIGAGGASQSVVLSLLQAGANVYLVNRTHSKVEEFIRRFESVGKIYTLSDSPTIGFDGVISSTSEFNPDLCEPLAPKIVNAQFCYDLNYGQRADGFLNWARSVSSGKTSDGLGMLLGQAAHAFKIWTGVLPEIDLIEEDQLSS